MREHIDNFKALRFRDVIGEILHLGSFLSFIVVLWCTLSIATNCSASMVVVLSGSMEPGYYRGDILFLHRRPEYPIIAGDIIIYSMHNREIPIVHRVLRVHERAVDQKKMYLTKGDNNERDDRALYPAGHGWVTEDQVIGKTYAYVPRAGYLTILVGEVKILKYAALLLILFLLISSTD